MPRSTVFVGFASEPEILADTIRTAARRIDQLPDVKVQSWEDLRVGGTLLLDTIERAIRDADLAVFDLTQLNENVMFELGLAIGSDQPVWPLRDATDTSRSAEWNTLGLLDTVGQTRFTNSDQVFAKFSVERPDLEPASLLSGLLAQRGGGRRLPSVLYVGEPHQTDAGRALFPVLRGRASSGIDLVVADPIEASLQTLEWFVQHIYSAAAVVVHLASDRRAGAVAHNARAALVAGIARGVRRPLLMLAEADYKAALDYRDLLFRYTSAHDCATRAGYWLGRELDATERWVAQQQSEEEAFEVSSELQSVDLGEYVAENESAALSTYFIETSSYREILSGASRVYVGRKGAGKSANLIQGEHQLRKDKRNLVCVIKPPGYDLNGLVRLLKSYEERDAKGFIAESLWKYLLYTELALAIEQDLMRRPAGAMPNSPEWRLLDFASKHSDWVKGDFGSRLERAVAAVLTQPTAKGLADERQSISEALHAGPLRQLRELLAPALASRERVYVLIDNLDKAWDRSADIDQLTRVILGLLAGMDNFRSDLESATRQASPPIALSLFLRSDIYATVERQAREPDKLPVRQMRWDEEIPLLEVVEQRFLASRRKQSTGDELWERYFCSSVRGVPVRSYLLRITLPRPRDVLFICRAAIDRALSAKQSKVREEDVFAGERLYSQFAFEAVAVETELRFDNVADVLLEFAGLPAELDAASLEDVLNGASVPPSDHSEVIDELRNVSFLGLKVGDSSYSYSDEPREKARVDVLGRRYAEQGDGSLTYRVHPAFWSYLELSAQPGALRFEV